VPLGIAYAIWAGVGVVAVAIISWLVFHETLTWQQILGMVLVAGGVVLLEAGGKHE
jgi:small multidrug resistance pump